MIHWSQSIRQLTGLLIFRMAPLSPVEEHAPDLLGHRAVRNQSSCPFRDITCGLHRSSSGQVLGPVCPAGGDVGDAEGEVRRVGGRIQGVAPVDDLLDDEVAVGVAVGDGDLRLGGVDAVVDGQIVGADLNEQGILELLDRYERAVIVVTPLGGNGFIFGRGSKQFTPEVIRRVGTGNIFVVGTRAKVSQLECLRVDTGDWELDETLSGYTEGVVGYRERMVVETKC